MNYNQIVSDNKNYLNYMDSIYDLDIDLIAMVSEYSGIFLTQNSYVEQDLTFRLMGTFITKKGQKTKKKQLYSLGLKRVKQDGNEKTSHIKKDFEKLVLIFNQMKHYDEIKQIEVKKENLQATKI